MRSRLALAALALTTFAYLTVETMPIGLLPQIATGLHTRPSTVGLLVTAYGLVVVIATIPLTRLAHGLSRRRLLSVLLGVFVVSTALSAAAPNYLSLLAARVVTALSQAVFWAIVTPAAAALVRPARRGRAISIVFAGSSLGTLLGVPAGTWLGQIVGWRVPFAGLSGLGLVLLVALRLLLPEVPAGQGGTDRGTAPDRGRYRVIVVTTVLAVTAAFTVYTYVNPFLTQVSGVPESAIGPVLVVYGVADLLGVFVASLFVSRHGWPTMVGAVGLLTVALATLYLFGPVTVVAVVAGALTTASIAAMTTALSARILELAPGDTDDANAGTSTAFNVGITAGALIGAGLVDGPGVRSTALAGALIAVLAFAAVGSERVFASSGAGRELFASSGPGREPSPDREREVAGGDRLDPDGA
jgi:DHA1 family inner membrane transport protein